MNTVREEEEEEEGDTDTDREIDRYTDGQTKKDRQVVSLEE